jgi:hypothetical protein
MTNDRRERIRQRLRAVTVNGAIAFGALGVGLLIAEGAVRLLAPQQLIQIRPDIWQPADSVGWLHRAGVNTTINTGERTVGIVTDRDGFRVSRNGRTDAATQVLLVGDSFLEALQVEYDESLAGLLEPRLAEAAGRPVAVRNAANGGWGPNQYFLRTRSLVERDSFALVVVGLFMENDAIELRWRRMPPRAPVERNRFHVPRGLGWRELVDAFLAPVNDFFEVRSHLFVLLKNRLGTLRLRLGLTPAYFPVEFLKHEADGKRWTITADICRDLARAAAARGTPTLFVLIPTGFQVDPETFAQQVVGFGVDSTTVDLDQPNRRLAEELEARGLTVVDALPAFRAARADGKRLYGTVDPHLSPAGHSVLTSVVAPVAAELLDCRSAIADCTLQID